MIKGDKTMKRQFAALLISAPLLTGLTGCVVSVGGDYDNAQSDWEDREYRNRKKIANLKLGMSYDEVKSYLGTPDFNEIHKDNGQKYQVLFYRTHRLHGDGVTTKDECTPVIIKDGILDSWGEKAYETL